MLTSLTKYEKSNSEDVSQSHLSLSKQKALTKKKLVVAPSPKLHHGRPRHHLVEFVDGNAIRGGSSSKVIDLFLLDANGIGTLTSQVCWCTVTFLEKKRQIIEDLLCLDFSVKLVDFCCLLFAVCCLFLLLLICLLCLDFLYDTFQFCYC